MNFNYNHSIDKSMQPEENHLDDEKTPLLHSQTTHKAQQVASVTGLSNTADVRRVYKIGRQKIPKANIFIRVFSSIRNAIEEFVVKRKVAKLTNDEIIVELENIRRHIIDTEDEIYFQIDEEQKIDDNEFGHPPIVSLEQKEEIKELLKNLKKDLRVLKFCQKRIDKETLSLNKRTEATPIDKDHLELGQRQIARLGKDDNYINLLNELKDNNINRFAVRNLSADISEKVSYLEHLLKERVSKYHFDSNIQVKQYDLDLDIHSKAKALIDNKDYGGFIADCLDHILQNDSPKDVSDLKQKLLKKIIEDRVKEESIDRETFEILIPKKRKGRIPYDIASSYKYKDLKNLYDNGHWQAGEKYEIDFTSISVKDFEDAEKKIDEMFNDADFNKLLSTFIKDVEQDNQVLNTQIVNEINGLSVSQSIKDQLIKNVDVIRKGGDLHVLLADLINGSIGYKDLDSKKEVINFLRKYGFIDLNS